MCASVAWRASLAMVVSGGHCARRGRVVRHDNGGYERESERASERAIGVALRVAALARGVGLRPLYAPRSPGG